MGDAYKAAQLGGYSLAASEAYYCATLGSAKSLNLSDKVGNLSEGMEADFILVNSENQSNVHKRLAYISSIEEELFIYMIMGDARLIQQTYVFGELVYSKSPINGGLAA
jgi:guanine deaminase